MGTVVNWEGGWLDHFISHRSASSHERKMISVHDRPGLDWNQWPRDERLRGKGFYFVYGQTPLLSPPHSLSRSKPTPPLPPQKIINPPCALFFNCKAPYGDLLRFCYGPSNSLLCATADLSFKRDVLTSALLQLDRFWRGLCEAKQGFIRKSILMACHHKKESGWSKSFSRRQEEKWLLLVLD